MKLYKLFSFLPLIISLVLMTTVWTGCSDDDDEMAQTAGSGYVQFRVMKEASAGKTATRVIMDKLEKLSDAKKVKVVLQYGASTIEQTLKLNAFNTENAEFGLRSEKLELLAGSYKLIGYYLYDKLDEVIFADAPDNYTFSVVTDGMQVQNLYADAVPRGMASFKLMKHFVPTRAGESAAYPFANIKAIDIYVKNLFTQEVTAIKKVRVKYVENLKDAYATCDTVAWLKAGSYQISAYTTYSDKKATKSLETNAAVPTSKTFVVTDNQLTEEVEVPVQMSETAAYLKDYEALKAIWEALDGPNWRYYGEANPMGCNWNFDKQPDMWGYQPGVQLLENGRVASVVISGFGAKGQVPDAIGQLTELRILNLGAHDELIGGHLFEKVGASLTDEQRKAIRMDYDEKFLNRDVRSGFSDILVDAINDNPSFRPVKKDNRIQTKDVQFGVMTNQITGISKALMRCTQLENFFIANSPIGADGNFFVEVNEDSPFYEERTDWSWKNFKMLTDMEIYNCSKLASLPMDMLTQLPELQMLNVACNRSISDETLLQNWIDFIGGNSGSKIQVLYLGYNNLTSIPVTEELQRMEKLSFLDLTNNQLTKVYPFGKKINLSKLYLDHNKLTSIPHDEEGYFFGYYDTELFSCTNNKLTELPDIFNAKSKYVIKAIDFSYNEISKLENGDAFRGVNSAELTLAYNKLNRFPYPIFKAGSPISNLNLAGNGMTVFKEKDMMGPNSHLLVSLDLQFNNLKEIPARDFLPENVPYLYGIDLSYNQFSKFPYAPLNCNLNIFGIRHQRDDKGNRTLREWPQELYKHPTLVRFFIGSNDLRKIEDTISPNIRVFEIKDNPNISIDLSPVCSYIQAGYYLLIYDPTQTIMGCDILDLE